MNDELTLEQKQQLLNLIKLPKATIQDQINSRRILRKSFRYWLDMFLRFQSNPYFLQERIEEMTTKIEQIDNEVKVREAILETC